MDSSTDDSDLFIPIESGLENPAAELMEVSTATASNGMPIASCSTQVEEDPGKVALMQKVDKPSQNGGRISTDGPCDGNAIVKTASELTTSEATQEADSTHCDMASKHKELEHLKETRQKLKRFAFGDKECAYGNGTHTDVERVTRVVATLKEKDQHGSMSLKEDAELKERAQAVKVEGKENSTETSQHLDSDHEVPRKRSRTGSASSSCSWSQEGRKHATIDRIACQQEPTTLKKRTRRKMEYSPTDSGKQPYKAWQSKTCGKLQQTTLKFSAKVGNTDGDSVDPSQPCREVVVSRFASDSDVQVSESRQRKAQGRGKVGRVRPASVATTSDSDNGDVFLSCSVSSSHAVDSEARKQRSDFNTDAEYVAYIEEQDHILAQQLQADYNAEVKYHWNSIRRKGTPDGYGLRNSSLSSNSSKGGDCEPGTSGVKKMTKHKHVTGSRR